MPGKKPTQKDLDEFRARLQAVISILSGDIGHLQEEALGDSASLKEGVGDGGSDGYFQEMSLSLLERDASTMREVLSALERIDTGEFGKCESCGQWIAKERLRTVPHARNCIDCQRKAEEVA